MLDATEVFAASQPSASLRKNDPMRIIFAGTPAIAVPSLEAVLAGGHEVVGVLTRQDAPLGRKRILTPSPIAAAAERLGIPTLKANRLDESAGEWIRALQPDLGVIVAYGALLREPVLSLPELGWINLHFSELPRHRGAAPVQRALMAGEQTLGVTVFRLTEGLDDGVVLTRDHQSFAIGTTAGQALESLAEFGVTALLGAIELLQADAQAGEPQQGDSSYAHKLSRDDGRLDLSQPTAAVLAQWAGVTPEPGAWTECEGAVLKLLELAPRTDAAAPIGGAGASVQLRQGRAVLTLSDGEVELIRVQPAGKPAMDAAAWLRGRGGETVLS